MLSELRIRNYALIEQLAVRLEPGLNVLTGETGAGKSIIVGALGLLLGERASADAVRRGAERATVEGVFEVEGHEGVLRFLDDRGVEADGGVLVLKREVAAEGRSRAWVNGSPATAGLLSEIGRVLVDLHGQHEHQTLLRRDEQRAILDAYAGAEAARERVRATYDDLVDARRELEALEARRRSAEERTDLLRFQAEEIERAAPVAGEEEALEDEARRLGHSEELGSLSTSVHQALSGDERSVLGHLGALRRPLDQLVRIDPVQQEVHELYDTAFYALQELGERMERYATTVEHDPARLEEVRRRQDLLFRLRSKYGGTLAEVADAGRAARAELELIEGAGFELAELGRRERAADAALAAAAAELTARRAAATERLAAEVNEVLPQLGMEGGRFEAVALPLSTPSPRGAEEIEFRVALNRGFEPRPIAQVASGGELSRVMLALKTVLARLDAVPTLVFDEVDAGIGGRVALQVGEKMREVAAAHQVFAITHLPQIASRAHLHLRVEKGESDGVGTTRVRPLADQERVHEIARMLGGDPESAVSLEHARELLQRGAA